MLLTFHIGNTIVSQEPQEIKLPSVLPPSPEAAAINKNGQMSVGLYNGAAQASIPIHSFKVGGLSLPISLDYSTTGTKVDEIPSRVGMGWTLNAGGVVSRVVHGAPDDQTTRLAVPNSPATPNSSNLTFYLNINPTEYGDPPTNDAEPDEFRYNAPGLSGKFVLDNSGTPVEIPYTGNKIQVFKGATHYYKVVITNLQGVIYEFGDGPEETTYSHIYVTGLHGWQTIKTAFYLKKITFPNKDYVSFNYSAITITSATGASQSVTRSDGGTNLCNGNPPACATNSYTDLSTKVSLVTYNSYYLSSINATDGTLINFSYASRPDYSGDNRVTSVTVSIPGSNSTPRTYVFNYIDPTTNSVGSYPGSTLTNQRFFLKEFTQIATNPQEITDSIKYVFDYDDVNNLPRRLAYSQDHFGYYNGVNNSYALPTTSDGYGWGGYNLADKTPNPTYAKKGTLVKITYPTGGYEEFQYESNTVPQIQQVQSTSSISVSGPGLGESSNNVWTGTINSIQYNQEVNLVVAATHNMYYWESIYQSPPANDPAKPVTIEFKNTTTNTVIYTSVRMVNSTITVPVTIVAGNNYQVKVTVNGQAYHGRCDVSWDPGAGVSYVTNNVATGGLRVRKIASYDPVSNKTTNRFYSYHFLADANKISSGIGTYIMGSGDYKNRYSVKTYCPSSCAGCFNLCSFETLMSNSAIPLYAHSGNIVSYRAVIESDDSLFLTGGIEHQYELPEITTGFTVLNDGIKGISKDSYTSLGGMEILTSYFNKDKTILKKIKNTYKIDTTAFLVPALTSRRNYNHITTTPVSDDDLAQFDASVYSWTSMWIQHDSTITSEYDLNGGSLITYSVDSYGARINTLPVKTETLGSDNQKIEVFMKYPNHYGTSPYTDMTTARMLSSVVEKKVIRNTAQISLEMKNYYIWYPGTSNTALIIEPQTLQTQKSSSSTQESRIHYHAYDSSGNILELSKENGTRISYIWNYLRTLPVAEIKNGSITQDAIAYSSFETSDKGYWTFSGATSSDNSCPTGAYVYSLGGGNVTKSVNSAKTYIITYWLKNSSGSVSVSGTAISGFPKTYWTNNGWTLYEHRVTGTSTVTISGSGTIDELRLYPLGAYMSTMTYSPGAGISSASSINNTLTRYEYDHFNRLKAIRDGNRNILKMYDYAFKQSFTACSNTTANWTATGIERCVQTGPNNNYNGQKEKQEKDLNNCSSTYLQTRWVSITPTGCSTTSCSGEGFRIPTGGSSCIAGQKIFIYQTYLGGGNWECKYYYYWTEDGYRSQDYISTNISVCEVD